MPTALPSKHPNITYSFFCISIEKDKDECILLLDCLGSVNPRLHIQSMFYYVASEGRQRWSQIVCFTLRPAHSRCDIAYVLEMIALPNVNIPRPNGDPILVYRLGNQYKLKQKSIPKHCCSPGEYG